MKRFHIYLNGRFVQSVTYKTLKEAKEKFPNHHVKPATRGRPILGVKEIMTTRGIRMLAEQWKIFDRLGGAKWLRIKIDQAKVKGEE